MKLINILDDRGQLRLAISTPGGVIDTGTLPQQFGGSSMPQTTDDVIRNPEVLGALAEAAGAGRVTPLSDPAMKFGPCLTRPEKIICIGLNYRQHAIESGFPIPTEPVVFSKFNNSLAGHHQAVPLLASASSYDYEVELGVVIGRQARNVEPQDALNHVFGYCSANDLSARDLQMRSSQWLIGKTLDAFMPVGPFLVTSDEIADPQNLSLKTWVNGELRQDSNTSDMIFPVAEIISYLSRYMTLKPGDLISTGTPPGVLLGMENPNWLKAGDEVAVEVGELGRLANRLVER